jgi:hypothetical protein
MDHAGTAQKMVERLLLLQLDQQGSPWSLKCYKKGSRYTCSYEEEKAAKHLALDWMLENSRSTDAVICTDSQSQLSQSKADKLMC